MSKSTEVLEMFIDLLPTGAVYTNLPEVFRRYNAMAARTLEGGDLELLVPSIEEDAEAGDYGWYAIEELSPGANLRVVN